MTIAAACLPILFFLAYAIRWPAVKGAIAQEGKYDNIEPRKQQARLTGKAARAQACHQNTLEIFAPFAAAVWVAHAFSDWAALRDLLAVLFVLSRGVYVYAYLNDWGNGRSVVWIVGWLLVLLLFLMPLVS